MALALLAGLFADAGQHPVYALSKIWLGAGSTTDWFNCANWSDGICPANTDQVFFTGTSSRSVTFSQSATVTVAGFSINNQYTGTIHGSAPLQVNGDMSLHGGRFVAPASLVVRGNFDQSTGNVFVNNGGTVVFSGPVTQTVDVANVTFNNVSLVNGGAGTTLVQLKQALDVNGTLSVGAGTTLEVAVDESIALAGDWQNAGVQFVL